MTVGPPRHGKFHNVARGIGYFDRVVLRDMLEVHGWILSTSRMQIESFALYVDGDLVATTVPQFSPETVLPPMFPPGVAAFFLFENISLNFIPREFAQVAVVACVAGTPMSRIATPLRRNLASVPSPPEHLMVRVTGNSNPVAVKTAGLRCAGEFLESLAKQRPLQSLRRVLDWGCGCARVTVHLIDALAVYPQIAVDGCDIDDEAVRWAQSNVPGGTFTAIEPYPPLPWDDATFDAVFSCSVFTHLSREAQAMWLAEMMRVIAPGGMLLASISSGGTADFSDDVIDGALDGIAPAGYYRGTSQSRAYTLSEWARWFDVAEFIPGGLESSQDLVVMRRRAGNAVLARAAESMNYRVAHEQVHLSPPIQAEEPVLSLEPAPIAAPLPEPFPSGHFYSPIPSMQDIERVFGRMRPSGLQGIDMRHDAQLELFHKLKRYYPDLPFGRREGLRYTFDNPHFGHSDAITLYSMIREFQPARIVEVGSGYSSCVMIDTVELFLGGATDFTFIDPSPELLVSLLKPGDQPRIVTAQVQDVEESTFTALQAGDILFIDSTHVLKAGSDVNHLLFEVLPILNSGVLVHFHDIFHPFEYPRAWLRDLGLAWNEIYAVRAFLQFNSAFEIAFSNTYMAQAAQDLFRREMPLCFENTGGSLWLRRK